MFARCGKVERERLALALFLIFGAVIFWTLFDQAGLVAEPLRRHQRPAGPGFPSRPAAGRGDHPGHARAAGRRRPRPPRDLLDRHQLQRRPDPGPGLGLAADLRPGVRLAGGPG
ncbi:hypothetical protein ACRAWD_09520 [Caulobacter segnis]